MSSPETLTAPPTVSILIVTYNCSQVVKDCISSVLSANIKTDYEILLRDNASQDAVLLAALESSTTHVFLGEENIGFGKANNLLASQSHAPYLLLLNPDTELSNDIVTPLINYLRTHPEVGIVAPALCNTDGSPQFSWNQKLGLGWEFAETHYLQNIWRRYFLRQAHRISPDGPWSVDFVSGACCCISSDLWKQLLGFDSDFFLNHEDIELCDRVRALGKQIHVLPNLTVLHHDGGTQRLNWKRFVRDRLNAKWIYLH
jgi:GT2 family glycosyltransferase